VFDGELTAFNRRRNEFFNCLLTRFRSHVPIQIQKMKIWKILCSSAKWLTCLNVFFALIVHWTYFLNHVGSSKYALSASKIWNSVQKTLCCSARTADRKLNIISKCFNKLSKKADTKIAFLKKFFLQLFTKELLLLLL